MNSGELIVNGGMEAFSGSVPTGWSTTAPAAVSRVTEFGRVHSGEAAVALSDGANLTQIVSINEGCFYELSFFARGEGAQVGFTATVTFIPGGEALRITVRKQDLTNSNRVFAYFKGITERAPAGASSAEIRFEVEANGNQSLDLDDVSFSIA